VQTDLVSWFDIILLFNKYRLQERPGKSFVRPAAPHAMIETTRDGSDIVIIIIIIIITVTILPRYGLLACARDDDDVWLSVVGYDDANNRSLVWRRARGGPCVLTERGSRCLGTRPPATAANRIILCTHILL